MIDFLNFVWVWYKNKGFVLLFSLLFIQCQEKGTIIIRYAHVGVTDEPQSMFADSLAQMVNERTSGRVEIRVYPNSQLGNISELVDGVKYGFIGMSHHDFASLSRFDKDLSVFNAPYIYRDIEHALKATNPATSSVLEHINNQLVEASKVRILGSFYRGARQLTTNFPVYTLEDLKGKKIRGVPFPVWMSMIKGMGAIPTPVEFSELTTALLTGMVVGQENPLSNIFTSGIYEVQSHIAMTNHMHSCLAVFIHEALWQKIQHSDQEIIMDAIEEAAVLTAEHIVRSDERIVQELLKHGIVFTNEQNGLQVETIKKSVLNQFRDDFPEWVEYTAEIQRIK